MLVAAAWSALRYKMVLVIVVPCCGLVQGVAGHDRAGSGLRTRSPDGPRQRVPAGPGHELRALPAAARRRLLMLRFPATARPAWVLVPQTSAVRCPSTPCWASARLAPLKAMRSRAGTELPVWLIANPTRSSAPSAESIAAPVASPTTKEDLP